MLMNMNTATPFVGGNNYYTAQPAAYSTLPAFPKQSYAASGYHERNDSIIGNGANNLSHQRQDLGQDFHQQLQTQIEVQQQLQQQYLLLQLNTGYQQQQQQQQQQQPVLFQEEVPNELNRMQRYLGNEYPSNNAQQLQELPHTALVAPSNFSQDVLYYGEDNSKPLFQDCLYIYNGEEEAKTLPFEQVNSPPISDHTIDATRLYSDPASSYSDAYIKPNYQLQTPVEPKENDFISHSNKRLKKKPKTLGSARGITDKYTSQPGPIPASAPEIIVDSITGEELLIFSYSKKKIVTKFSLRCPQINFTEPLNYDEEFLKENCIYPGAMCAPEEYQGKRGNYERECNVIGWKLAHLNPEIRGRRGLIQRAVDSWRNTGEDSKIRSRRVRKEFRMRRKKAGSA